MRILLFIIVLVSCTSPLVLANPQRKSQLKFGSQLFPYSDVENAPNSDVSLQYSINYVSFDFPILINKKKGRIFKSTLYTEYLPFNFKNQKAEPPARLAGLNYSFTYVQFLSPNWQTTLNLKPGFYSDLEGFKRNSFRLQGALLLNRVIKKRFRMGAGLAVVNNFGEPELLPAFLVDVNTDGDGRPSRGTHILDLKIPIEANYFYVLSERIQWGVLSSITGNNYRINKEGLLEGFNMAFSVGTVGPAIKLFLKENFIVRIDGGWIFRQRLEVKDDDREVANLSVKETGYGRMEFSWKI